MVLGKFCVVRCRDAGVHCGIVREVFGRSVLLHEARRLHGWADGANTLSEVATTGPGTARISVEVAEVLLLDACEVTPCTPEAEANLRESRWNLPPASSASSPPAPRRSRSRPTG